MSVARHPLTGAPIRIMRSEAHISRDQKTLVYLTSGAESSPRWPRWQTLISDKEGLAILEPVKPNYLLLWNKLSDEDVTFWQDWLRLHNKALHILFVSATVAGQLGNEIIQSVNVICYNEMFDLYPFIESELKDDSPILQVVFAIATVFRYNRLVIDEGLESTDSAVMESARIYEKQEGQLIKAKLTKDLVPKFVLIQQYFQHPFARRSRELKECLLRNIKNPFIDEVHLLNEISYPEWLKYPKIKERVIVNRLSFDAVLTHIKQNIPNNTIVAFANTDIYFDATIRHLYSITMEKKFLSLLRWDDPNPPQIQDEERQPSKIFGPRPDSQDTWILRSDDVTFDTSHLDFQIPFGKAGCDNALNVGMLKQKFLIANPAYTIKTHHIHLSAIRDYNPQDIIEKPVYLYIEPTEIQEHAVVKALTQHKIFPEGAPASAQTATVKRQIKYVNENAAATICSMLKRQKVWEYAIKEDNEFVYQTNNEPTIYQFKNKFMSAKGLFYGMKEMYVSNNPIWQEGWESNTTNILATTLYVPTLMAIYMTNESGTNIPLWCLNYLAKALSARKLVQQKTGLKPEFIVCQKHEMGDFLGMLEWPATIGSRVNLVPYDEKLQYYADTLFPVEPTKTLVSPTDISVLRELIPSFLREAKQENSKPIVVFCIEEDDQILSKAWFERIQSISFSNWRVHRIGAKTSPKSILQVLASADLIIGQADSKWSALSWMWAMKPSASVIEVMRDTNPVGENIHLAGVAGLQYIVVVAKREPIDLQREHAMIDINTATKNFCYEKALSADVPASQKPTVVIPTEQVGLHEHSGDTFREMAEIWAERGYIQLQRSSTTHYCWLHGVGKILLYDRPTLKWLEPNLLFEFGLFGNPTPPLELFRKSSMWSFWPRSPRKIEDFVKNHIPTYEERTTSTIFLGKVENGVQMKNRPLSWQPHIQKWSMPLDSTGQAYPYTQDEYLLEVSKSRFGLCLAGYGPKCNREMEYFALGTVPICAPEVDMKYYINPPQEGVHYLRVSRPEDIATTIEKITENKWKEMSSAGRRWWLENASAEGMFRLTLSASMKKTALL